MQGVQARCDAELPPYVSIVRHPGRPVILGMEDLAWLKDVKTTRYNLGVSQRPLTLILLQKYRDTNGRRIAIQIGGVYTTFCQEEGILLQKYRDRIGRCIAILFKSIGVRGRFDSPEIMGAPKADKRSKAAESSRESLERTLGKTLPNHEVQVWTFLCFFFYRLFSLPINSTLRQNPPEPGWNKAWKPQSAPRTPAALPLCWVRAASGPFLENYLWETDFLPLLVHR